MTGLTWCSPWDWDSPTIPLFGGIVDDIFPGIHAGCKSPGCPIEGRATLEQLAMFWTLPKSTQNVIMCFEAWRYICVCVHFKNMIFMYINVYIHNIYIIIWTWWINMVRESYIHIQYIITFNTKLTIPVFCHCWPSHCKTNMFGCHT